jgi:hypothetical protein
VAPPEREVIPTGEKHMTHEEWLACDYVEALSGELEFRASPRKLWLFGAACLRRVWRLLDNEAARLAVEVTEQYVDARISRREFIDCLTNAELDLGEGLWLGPLPLGFCDCPYCMEIQEDQWERTGGMPRRVEDGARNPSWAAARAVFHARELVAWETGPKSESAVSAEEQAQHALLLDLLIPERAPRIDPAWVYSGGAAVLRVARAIYDERAFDRMPILADALEDFGCIESALLDHLREPGVHIRGCWVLDQILGRE